MNLTNPENVKHVFTLVMLSNISGRHIWYYIKTYIICTQYMCIHRWKNLPVMIISSAAGTPINRGSRWVPPAPGSKPIVTSGKPTSAWNEDEIFVNIYNI